jgi:hypothetical protein
MDLEEEFRQSASRIRGKDTPTTDPDLFILYGLYTPLKI